MAVYDIDGLEPDGLYGADGGAVTAVYDLDGNLVGGITPVPLDYSSYSTSITN